MNSTATIKIFFKGGTFFNNPKINMLINGIEPDIELRATGFELEMPLIKDGPVHMELKFGIRRQDFHIERDAGESLNLELSYRRLWGNFKLKPRS